ncbi:hypothetical protein EPR50_G00183800 [Perca flavescens]|uniref:CCHC-type domain-containing protein n=1 Tax=Perca flavescens TaxID=8167 RepID=A0A484CDH3_PERFV|nr:hypothetical protein EPR50_G00183800 [Perca flavescens]
MASFETPPPSLRQGVRIAPPESNVTVEEVLLAVGEQVGYDNLSFASRMNKAVVVFMKDEQLVHQLIESGVFIRDSFVQVSPLSVPSTRITVSGVPPFIPDELLGNELQRFGKFASGFKTVTLGCKDPKLRHVQSLRRQVFMFLDSPTQTLEVSFRVKHGHGSYMVYASSGQLKCFECGDVGHKRFACPHRQQALTAGEAAAPETPSADEACGPGADDVAPGDGSDVAGLADAGGVAADRGVADAAGGEVKEGNVEKQSQSEQQQVPPQVESHSECVGATAQSQSGITGEVASTSLTRDHTGITSSITRDHTGIPSGEQGGGLFSSQASCASDDMEFDSESDTVSIGEINLSTDLYSLEEIDRFLNETFKRSVKVTDYFKDTEKFIKSVAVLKRLVGFDLLDKKKRYRLKKHITTLRKEKGRRTSKRIRTSNDHDT